MWPYFFFFIFLCLIRIFLSWNYVRGRLNNCTIFYEESSWYDGQLWTKSESILFQERLLYNYQVVPLLKKIKYLLLQTLILFLSFLILFKI
jgi:hypothetical protein